MTDRVFLSAPHLDQTELGLIEQAIARNEIAMGEFIGALEQRLADYAGVAGAVAVSSGTAALHLALDVLGIGPGDVCAVTFGYHLFVAGLFYQTQMEAHGVACIPLGPGEAARAVDVCNRHGVTVLAGNPTFSLKLIEEGLTPPKVFFAGGEPFTGNPTLYSAVRAAMPETMLVDAFSLSEFLPVARTFPGGTGVHVFDELVHAEVSDPATGDPVADGDPVAWAIERLRTRLPQMLERAWAGDVARELDQRDLDQVLPRVIEAAYRARYQNDHGEVLRNAMGRA